MKLLMMLLCKGTYVPVAPPFRGQGAMPPWCTPFRHPCLHLFSW